MLLEHTLVFSSETSSLTMHSATRLDDVTHHRLLEHTLIFSGETVQAGSTWQGWPAECVAWTLLEESEYATYSTIGGKSTLGSTGSRTGSYKRKAGTQVSNRSGMVLGFEQNDALKDAIESHDCWREASTRVIQ
jgi:hypothetical protein